MTQHGKGDARRILEFMRQRGVVKGAPTGVISTIDGEETEVNTAEVGCERWRENTPK